MDTTEQLSVVYEIDDQESRYNRLRGAFIGTIGTLAMGGFITGAVDLILGIPKNPQLFSDFLFGE